MKTIKKISDLFFKYTILIFVLIVLLPFIGKIQTVYASGFEDWKFEIHDEAGKTEGDGISDAQKFTISISDGADRLGEKTTKGAVWNELIQRYKIFIMFFLGIATLTLVVIAMLLFVKLSASGSNPQERANVVKWIGIFLVAAGLLGSAGIVFAYSYGIFRK